MFQLLILTKEKKAISLGVELSDEREEISDEDAPLVLVQCVNESGYKFKEPKNFLDLYTTIASYFVNNNRTGSGRTLGYYRGMCIEI